jgi:adenosine/AMP kinase
MSMNIIMILNINRIQTAHVFVIVVHNAYYLIMLPYVLQSGWLMVVVLRAQSQKSCSACLRVADRGVREGFIRL